MLLIMLFIQPDCGWLNCLWAILQWCKAGGFSYTVPFFSYHNWWNGFYLSQGNWDEMKIWERNNQDQNTLGIYNISPPVTVTHNGVWHATWSHGGLSLLACCVTILGGEMLLTVRGRDLVCDGDTETGRRVANVKSSVSMNVTDRQWMHHLSLAVWSFCLN